MANAEQYINYFNEENAAVGGYQLSQNQQYDTDWFDEILNVGHVINNNVSVSGGMENVNYFLSYNMRQE
ncbi:MAG: hypothetical protein GWN56_09990, partial [Nitrosopumilaceae archaeon]|nr:hypothetical protein [Nitrosopumilaceae archaeon]